MRREKEIPFNLNESMADFYLDLLLAYQHDRYVKSGRIDVGVQDDIDFLKAEMELRGWLDKEDV